MDTGSGWSLADNDRVLAHLSMAGDRWPDVREMALRGWEKADDGRLYHAVVCEKVNMMLDVRARKSAAGRKGGSRTKSQKKQNKITTEAAAKQQLSYSKATVKLQPSSFPSLSSPFPSSEEGKKDTLSREKVSEVVSYSVGGGRS